jgi:septum formation protein
MHQLILASQSPRRKQILSERGYVFRAFPIEVSEILNKNLNIPQRISDCARQKAEAAMKLLLSEKNQEILVLSADTVVVLDQDILLKPTSESHAHEMLTRLSARSHQVITGFCLCELKSGCLILGHDITQVTFRHLCEQEILDYIKTGDPMDKAGAYGIQGSAKAFVQKIAGSFLNVVGLPIEKIEQVVAENGWTLQKRI